MGAGGAVSWLVIHDWFVKVYLRAGRAWLAWTILIVRAVLLTSISYPVKTSPYQAMLPLQRIRFLGEPVTVPKGVVNPWQLVTQSA